MTPERWHRLQELFFAAVSLPPEDRLPFLEAYCGEDTHLLADALGMLEGDQAEQLLIAPDLKKIADQIFEDEPDPYIHRTFGVYRFKSKLAEGGMSWVYLADRLDYDGIVAIKVLHDPMSSERQHLFDQEKRLLSRLKHPSIARLYDAGVLDDGAAFFAMEFVEGVQLTTYCRDLRVDLKQRLALFNKICEATRYAHERGIIHRDLKPSNILVETGGVIKLLDFGVSEQIGDLAKIPSSSSYMTVAYAAPEQIRKEPVDIQADIYSLGVILQQLVTGQLPFDVAERTAAEICEAILTQQPKKPSEVAREPWSSRDLPQSLTVPPAIAPATLSRTDWDDLDHICAMCLTKDPAARYASVQHLADDLERFEQRRPLPGRRSSRTYVAFRFLQRNRRPLLVAIAFTCCVLGLIAFYTLRLIAARNAALAEAARTERIDQFMQRLLTGDDPQNGPSKDLRVVTVLEHGVRDAQALNTDPPIQAELYQTLAGIYGTMSDFQTSEPLFRSALEEQTHLYGAESAQVASTLADLSILRLNEGKPDEAEEIARKAIAIDKKKLPATAPQKIQAQIGLGLILVQRGRYTDAVPLLEEAVVYESGTHGVPYYLSAALSNLANAYFYLGQLDKAEKLDNQSLDIDRKLKGDNNIDIAQDLMSLAELNERTGNLVHAEEMERRALLIEQNWYRTNNQPEVAGAMTILAQTLSKQNRNKEALPFAEEALAIRNRIQAAPDMEFAHAWNAAGLVNSQLGNYKEAQRDYKNALALYQWLLPASSYQIGVSLDDLAGISFEQGQYAVADRLSQRAVAMLTVTLPPDDAITATAKVHYARVLGAEHRPEEAKALLLSSYTSLSKNKKAHEVDLKRISSYLEDLYREKTK